MDTFGHRLEGDTLTSEDETLAEADEVVGENSNLPRLILAPRDPSDLSYPPSLAIEVALGDRRPSEICEAYGITRDKWDELCANPIFVRDVQARLVELNAEGMSFKMKAQLQAVALLSKQWELIHNKKTPPNVAASLIINAFKIAGLDASRDQATQSVPGTALQININLGEDPIPKVETKTLTKPKI